MSAESIFTLCGMIVLPGWLLMAFLPRWRPGATLIAPVIIPAILGLIYAWLLFTQMGTTDGGFGNLAGVRELFSNDFLLLAGWIHYLAFDLFIGSWEVRDAQRLGIPHWLVIPCLFMTLMLGPLGLLLYLAFRIGWKRRYFLGLG